MTILGTRPEIIRLSRVINLLDKSACRHILVHTGQNTHANLSDVFFKELSIRKPDYMLDATAPNGSARVGAILSQVHALLEKERPDKILILGDTFSGMSAYSARLLGIPVYHMEAGNRCFDDRVPEEINRPLIDRLSTINLPYTNNSRRYLLAEGFDSKRVIVAGNPMYEVLKAYKPEIDKSSALKKLGLKKDGYFLLTFHRAENVDNPKTLKSLVLLCERLATKYKLPVIVSTHPRTADRMKKTGVKSKNTLVRFMEPVGFFDFIALTRAAFAVLSDSGTVPEESAILGVPSVILRDTTERPELLENKCSVLSGVTLPGMLKSLELALKKKGRVKPPAEYIKPHVSKTVVGLLLKKGAAR